MNRKDWLQLVNAKDLTEYDKLYTFSTEDLIEFNSTSSKGNQRKWKSCNGKFYVKEQLFENNVYCSDNKVEVIASDILKQLQVPYSFADYYLCSIKDKNDKITSGCVSANFVPDGYELITLYRILEKKGISWESMLSVKDCWKYICDIMQDISGADCKNYLATLFLCDYLVLNTDRHLNNIAFLRNINSLELQPSPMFDFGRGLLECDAELYDMPVTKAVDKTRLRPFGFRAVKVIDVILSDVDILSKYNKVIDITNFEFPNLKSKELLTLLCSNVGLSVKEVVYD